MIKTNYHTHTRRCGHAQGSDEQYVLAAIEAGLEELGFSDHMPYPDASNPSDRMEYSQLDEYISSINQLKEKYKNQIKIYSGFELEFFPERLSYYQEIRSKVDYLICGQHYKVLDEYGYDYYTSDEDVIEYANQVIQAMESGLISFLAHPSYFMLGRQTWSKACDEAAHMICKCAQDTKIPLEINLKGTKYGQGIYNGHKSYRYPNLAFWEIASKYNVKAVIGIDAHSPIYLLMGEEFEKMRHKFTDLGIEILEKLEI